MSPLGSLGWALWALWAGLSVLSGLGSLGSLGWALWAFWARLSEFSGLGLNVVTVKLSSVDWCASYISTTTSMVTTFTFLKTF